ncbi:hypothetical protein TRIATDRAFT_302682 [Trichoderma atroviride IMI 206040]|uniref:Uncharacterized protein n=1 Tax=Hypocrea atroviridis (strain ATCC 20476 / IMI 206040) TaxID=452589 RepID=G9P9F2_HYPAI|nr:uncharacterized protein TRIATDRAFT_302682 [Trichoderma atroviride IMI 206040]EHK40277.1 hypothetical protein TRIATDRAFT_302682 [Trichoderma atroviride IMI 206040]
MPCLAIFFLLSIFSPFLCTVFSFSMILQIVYCARVEAVMNKITHKPKHLDWIWLWDIRDVVYQNAQGTIYLLIYCFVSLFFFKLSRKFDTVCWDYCSVYPNWCVLVFV